MSMVNGMVVRITLGHAGGDVGDKVYAVTQNKLLRHFGYILATFQQCFQLRAIGVMGSDT